MIQDYLKLYLKSLILVLSKIYKYSLSSIKEYDIIRLKKFLPNENIFYLRSLT